MLPAPPLLTVPLHVWSTWILLQQFYGPNLAFGEVHIAILLFLMDPSATESPDIDYHVLKMETLVILSSARQMLIGVLVTTCIGPLITAFVSICMRILLNCLNWFISLMKFFRSWRSVGEGKQFTASIFLHRVHFHQLQSYIQQISPSLSQHHFVPTKRNLFGFASLQWFTEVTLRGGGGQSLTIGENPDKGSVILGA